jgi:surfactin family lipopeptide synthetase A
MPHIENDQAVKDAKPKGRAVSDLQRALVAKYIGGLGNKGANDASITRRPPNDAIPISFSQQQVWLHSQMARDIPFYNQIMTVYRHGPLNVAVLQRCLREMICRHEIWRTTFDVVRDEPVQIVHPAPENFPWEVVNLSALPEAEREREALRLATADVRRPFDLKTGPLLRGSLVSFDDQHHRLYMTFHHLVFDGVSAYEIFLPELEKLYEAFSAGQPSPLPEPKLQYADFAYWQRNKFPTESWSDDLAYWRKQLSGDLPPCQLPTDRPRSVVQTHRGAVERFALPADLAQKIRSASQSAGVTVYVTLLAGLVALLDRYTSQEDLVVGCLTSLRNRPELEGMVGHFMNPLALRIDVTGDPTFRELQARARKIVFEGLSHRNVPFLQVVKDVHPRHDPGRNPLFQVMLSQQPKLPQAISGWNLATDEASHGGAELDLLIVVDDRGSEIFGPITYNTDLFDASSIRRMVEHWQTLLASACEYPDRRISELSVLTEAERRQILIDWNDTGKVQAQAPVTRMIQEQAKKLSRATAVQCGDRQLSYAQLDSRADQLAQILREKGVGPDVPVAICVERSIEMIVGILGILKAGGAYVPLDPSYPRGRLEFMLADCRPKAVLTQSRLASSLPSDIPTVLLDSVEWKRTNADQNRREPSLKDLAYVIYTSGSTGSPKGVLVTHGNLAHSNQARFYQYGEGGGGRFLLLSPYAFDSSVATIFHCLSSGGTLVIPGEKFRWEAEQLSALIADQQISHILCFPSLYGELLEHGSAAQLVSLRTVIVAGEACPRQLVNAHYRLLPQVSLFNEYGPTEATVWSTVYECEPAESEDAVPIGRPIANTQVYVLDGRLEPVAAGIRGELYIGGDGVAAGYLNHPELTETRFVPNPFSNDANARLYRTGDLVRYRSDGVLEFLGRIDQQVKIHGLRIELGEIETVLKQHPEVQEAVVVTHSNGSGELQLAAFVATRDNCMSSSDEQRRFLKSRLPAYMIPASFQFLKSFPTTPNGKIDRRRLLDSEFVAIAATKRNSTPRNEVEQRLLTIWQSVLKSDSVNVTQDFFEMGGHSLLAAKLLANIEREFGRVLSLAFIFQCPTIEQMAESLSTAGQSLRDRAIVPIQPKGSRPALFWIRGGPRFRLLAKHLGPEQPFLGLDLPYTDGAKLPVPYRMEDIAELLIRGLREEQPHGPYYLAGLCVNAVLAYEVARQLQQSGEEIALLAMFDGHNRAYYKNPFADGRYSQRIKNHLSNLWQMDIRQTPGYVLDRLDEARRKIERITWQLMADRNDRVRNTDSIVHPAFHRYEPQPYAGKAVLLQSSDWPSGPYFDFKLGWDGLVKDGVEFYRIPGDHPSMFTNPNVRLVAEKLRLHLTRSNV